MTVGHSSRWGIVFATVSALWSVPSVAMDASTKETVRALANDGAAEFEAGRYKAALEKFQRAFDAARVPTLALWIAKTQVKLEHFVAANEMYRQAINLEESELWVGTAQQEAQHEAQEGLATLQPRIPRLTIRVKGANPSDVSVKIDDGDVPSALIGVERFADPGQKRIVGRLGNREVREQVTLSEGEKKELELVFPQALAPAAPSTMSELAPKPAITGMDATTPRLTLESPKSLGKTQRTWGWVGIGIGAAGAIFGAATGIIVVADHSAMTTNCPNHQCTQPFWSDVDKFDTLRHLSTGGFIVAGAGIVTGATLLLTTPKQESRPGVGLWLTPASAGARGTF